MTSGMWPTARHEGKLWRGDSDAAHSQLAGTPLGFIGIVLLITGDWAEYSSTLGFTTCTRRLHPCFACHCEYADMHQTNGFRPGHLPWAVKDHDRLTRQLVIDANGGSRCRVQPNTQMWLHILRGASRIQGPRRRDLDADIPALGLKKHDRLEPWTGLQDIGDEFDQLQPTAARPVRVCFWRRSEETATRHRSPLLDTGLHTSVNSLTIDILHTWFLGIHPRFLGWVWWRMLEGNLFRLRVASAEALIQEGIIRLRTPSRRNLDSW